MVIYIFFMRNLASSIRQSKLEISTPIKLLISNVSLIFLSIAKAIPLNTSDESWNVANIPAITSNQERWDRETGNWALTVRLLDNFDCYRRYRHAKNISKNFSNVAKWNKNLFGIHQTSLAGIKYFLEMNWTGNNLASMKLIEFRFTNSI